MDAVLFIGFLTTTLLFVAVPGPSVAFATAQAVRYGPRAAYVTVAGDALGTIVHIVVAVSSLTVLLSLSAMVLPFLQIAGGLFILGMAYQAIFRTKKLEDASVSISGKVTFWAGFFACVANPKAIVFFVALFPAFISPEHSIFWQSIVYGAVFLVLDAISILGYALATMHAVKRTTSRWLNPELLSGLGLLGVGMAMIVKGYRAIPHN
ncbi:LysE family translocator [Litoreibacter roseus]|uniref:Threonine/homoserine/homoserine lactone efflux protein n=1 Tax=Litoreibacter roseus TaxID=2601869 RepID=A0A6N6JIX3_9RHOB|nr:LysE family translocator [Litoreibacter roseus]GFE66025.1 hypothetical protein KIN_30990 [Litoreibacter roseus]